MSVEKNEFKPKIVAFCCNWCSTQELTLQEQSSVLSGRR